MIELKEKYVETGEITTHYWEAGSGKPLILIHGGGAGADAWGNWNRLMGKFAEQGYRTIAYDMVGYGFSSKPNPEHFTYDQDARVEQLFSFMEALGIEQASLVGNSLGGSTSLGLAIHRPEKVDKLILMGTGGRRRPGQTSASFKALYTFQNERDQMRQIIRHLTNPDFEIEEDLIDYRLKLANDPETSAAYAATMNILKEGVFIPDEEIQKIKHKTLLLHGRDDHQVPVEISFELVKIMENAWLNVQPNCGHWVMIEYPERFAKITLEFLEDD